jgi:hypothetical protein
MPISEERLKEIESIKDEDIDFSDISELDDDFFENAALVIRIANGIKIVLAPEIWHALAKTKEGLEYHINQIKLALKSYSGKQIA